MSEPTRLQEDEERVRKAYEKINEENGGLGVTTGEVCNATGIAPSKAHEILSNMKDLQRVSKQC